MPARLLRWLALATLSLSTLARAGQPGVLLMIADDLGPDLGCYGHRTLKTPRIDRLAAESVRFTRAYATTASCSASRSVIYTGLQNHANGQYGHAHAEHHFSQLDRVENIVSLARSSGLRTAWFGKTHVSPPEKYKVDVGPVGDGRNAKVIADGMTSFLRETGQRPFLIIVGFTDTHRVAGHGFRHQPGAAGKTRKKKAEHPPEPNVTRPETVTVPSFLPDAPAVREDVADYHDAVLRQDASAGMALDALAASGRADDTLVLFLSDNGMPFPGAKTNHYEPAVRLPLLIRKPGARPGVSDALVHWCDLMPTAGAHLGLKPPTYPLHGRDLTPLVVDPSGVGPDEILLSHTFHEVTNYYPMRTLVTRRYKLIHNLAHDLPFPFASDLFASPSWQAVRNGRLTHMGKRLTQAYLRRPEFELYDLESDPDEVRNRFDDPALAEVRADLQARLLRQRQRTGDTWLQYIRETGSWKE